MTCGSWCGDSAQTLPERPEWSRTRRNSPEHKFFGRVRFPPPPPFSDEESSTVASERDRPHRGDSAARADVSADHALDECGPVEFRNPFLASAGQEIVFGAPLARLLALRQGADVVRRRAGLLPSATRIGAFRRALSRLPQAAHLDLNDFLTFDIVPDAEHPEIEAEWMKYDGLRFFAPRALSLRAGQTAWFESCSEPSELRVVHDQIALHSTEEEQHVALRSAGFVHVKTELLLSGLYLCSGLP